MKLSPAGLELIRDSEGFRADAYRDAIGVWTIGYGHTATVRPGDRITVEQGLALLRGDVAGAEAAVVRAATVPLRQGQFDALVSFAFNLGAAALAGSTLLRRLNAGDTTGAAAEFPKWCHAGNQVLPGLVTRRARERALFEAPSFEGPSFEGPEEACPS
jgi:lysozyme